MTDDRKVCPFMSFHHPGAEVKCLEGRCMAWVPECPRDDGNCDCEPDDCYKMEREFMGCKGGCRLI